MGWRRVGAAACVMALLAACSNGGGRHVTAADGPTTTEAIATTTTTVLIELTTTTTVAPPTTTTTRRATTSTTAAGVPVTLVNELPADLDVTINGKTQRVAANSRVGPVLFQKNPKTDTDSVGAKTLDGQCGTGDGGPYLQYGPVTIAFKPDPSGQKCPNGVPTPIIWTSRAQA